MKPIFYFIVSTLTIASLSTAGTIDVNSPPERTIRIVNPSASVYSSPIVRNIGDFNGDGIIDFALAYPLDDVVYVIYGKRSFAPTINLSALGPNGFIIQGVSETNFGSAIVSPGDVDRDGKSDLAIGAPLEGMGGRVYLLKGSYNLQTISASDESSFALIVEGAPSENLGQYLGGGGSVDGNASADLLIPSPSYVRTDDDDNTILGAIYVIFGQLSFSERIVQTTDLDPETTLTLLNTPQQNGEYGYGSNLQAIGNFTGSGSNDLAFVLSTSASEPSAIVRILPGPISLKGVYTITDIPIDVLDVTIQLFETSYMHQIRSLTSCDLTGDGKTELILGFPEADLPEETLSGGVVLVVTNPNQQTGEIVVSSEDRTSAAILSHSAFPASLGVDVTCSSFGLYVSAPYADNSAGEEQFTGAVYALTKDSVDFSATKSTVTDLANVRFYGRESGDLFGASIAALGDLNKDGFEELLIGTSEIGDDTTAAYIIPVDSSATGIDAFWLY